MKKFSFILFLFTCFFAKSQYTVRIIVTDAATKKLDDIYVAGNFNGWQPGDVKYKLKQFGATRKLLVLDEMQAGHYEFKFTRGGWDKVETNERGEDISNHTLELSSDTTINFFIAGWHDDFPVKPIPNTASEQVQIIDTSFYIPQLNRYRRVWMYLPKNYDLYKSKKFPVLYMHDGQNLFNVKTSAFGEWGVDECLDTLQKKLNKDCIVVGIDNGSSYRMREYNPYSNEKFGKGEGDAYLEFIAKTLKPFIDGHYRTQPDMQHTFIAGSSMGGLISLYAVIKYPEVFGAAGVFSPSFWISPQMYTDAEKIKFKQMHRIFFYAGEKESDSLLIEMRRMEEILNKQNQIAMQEIVYPTGQHNEKSWQLFFDDFYKWLMQ